MKIYGVVGLEMKNNGDKVLTQQLILGADTETSLFWGEGVVEDPATAQKMADLLNKAELSSRQAPPS